MTIKSLVLGVALAASLGSTAKATSLVLNGSLDTPGNTSTTAFVNNPGTIPDWKISGPVTGSWNSVYIYDGVVSNGLSGQPVPPPYMPANYRLCDPAGGLQPGASCGNPDGIGHFINLDGDPSFPAAISQIISGLVIGKNYELTFSWAAVQRNDAHGPTSDEYLTITLGDKIFVTPNIFPGPLNDSSKSLPDQGFSGWMTESFDFTWNTNSVGTMLTFLANGNPGGLPPSVNLDGISLNAVPEPSTWALLIAGGFGLMGVAARRRRQSAVAD